MKRPLALSFVILTAALSLGWKIPSSIKSMAPSIPGVSSSSEGSSGSSDSSPAPAQTRTVAKLSEASGNIQIFRGDQTLTAETGMDLSAGDLIKTGADGRAVLQHQFGFEAVLAAFSTLRLSSVLFDISRVMLVQGAVEIQGRPGENQDFGVSTPVAILGVRGTAFLVMSAMDGSAKVAVREGRVTAGLGQAGLEIAAGQFSDGVLAAGFGSAAPGSLDLSQAAGLLREKDQQIKPRAAQVLEELNRLQKDEEKDWQSIEAEVTAASQRILQGRLSQDDRFFFRRVIDIEDRMAARQLLGIELREWAGITPPAEAQSERARLFKIWEARDWRRQAWEDVSQGRMPAQPAPDSIRQYQERAQKDLDSRPKEMPKTVAVLPDSGALFPSVVQGLYLGMTEDELKKVRPRAQSTMLPGMAPAEGVPVTYQEKQLSGGDWSQPGWFTGMYTLYQGKMVQAALLAFTGTETLRGRLIQELSGRFGKPYRFRLEPDWAQPGVIKGSTLEWQGTGFEIVLISRVVPTMGGAARGLELRIRLAGYEAILENAGQFQAATGSEPQYQTDFPEYVSP